MLMFPPGTVMEVRGLRATPRSVKEGGGWWCPAELSPHLRGLSAEPSGGVRSGLADTWEWTLP